MISALLGSEFSFLPAKVVAPASSTPVGIGRVSRATCPADLVEESVPLRELLLCDVSYRHFLSLNQPGLTAEYIVAA